MHGSPESGLSSPPSVLHGSSSWKPPPGTHGDQCGPCNAKPQPAPAPGQIPEGTHPSQAHLLQPLEPGLLGLTEAVLGSPALAEATQHRPVEGPPLPGAHPLTVLPLQLLPHLQVQRAQPLGCREEGVPGLFQRAVLGACREGWAGTRPGTWPEMSPPTPHPRVLPWVPGPQQGMQR